MPPVRLNSWKEIAAYLGRGVRTVQRWEKTFGLPVHRIGTGRGESVHATSDELEEWLRRMDESRVTLEGPADGNGAAAGTGEGANDAAGVEPGAEPGAERTLAGRAREGRPAVARRWLIAGAVAAGAVAGLVALAFVFRSAPTQPASFSVDVDTLNVFDAGNRLLFSRKFETRLLPAERYHDPAVRGQLLVIEDIDGDGWRETVLLVPTSDTASPAELVCLDRKGEVRFRHHPSATARFGEWTYPPPWEGYHLFTTGQPGRATLWVVWVHLASGEFPCLLERLSPGGGPASQYWSAGYIELVTLMTIHGTRSVLVGATNNDHKGASLAVFPEDAVRGSTPAEDPDKVCRDCPPGGPTYFAVFPRGDLAELAGYLPSVVDVRQDATGRLRVWVNQPGRDASGNLLPGAVAYDLSNDLVPTHAEIGAELMASHGVRERDGSIDHPFGDRDLQRAWPVLLFRDGRFSPVFGTTGR